MFHEVAPFAFLFAEELFHASVDYIIRDLSVMQFLGIAKHYPSREQDLCISMADASQEVRYTSADVQLLTRFGDRADIYKG